MSDCENDLTVNKIEWSISNYRDYPQEYLKSPHFAIGSENQTSWCLILHFIKPGDLRYIDSYLERVEREDTPEKVFVSFDIHLAAQAVNDCKKWMNQNICFRKDEQSPLAVRASLVPKKDGAIPDTLVVTCTMSSSPLGHFRSTEPHLNELSEDMSQLLRLGSLHDTILVCDGREVPVHRFIFECRMPAFAATLPSDFSTFAPSRSLVSDLSFGALQCLLKYAYCGEFEVSNNTDLMKIYVFARKYQVINLLRQLQSPTHSYKLKTEPLADTIALTWSYAEWTSWSSSMSPVFKLVQLERTFVSDMILALGIESINSDECLHITLQFPKLKFGQHLSVFFKIGIKNKLTNDKLHILKNLSHHFSSPEPWKTPSLVTKRKLDCKAQSLGSHNFCVKMTIWDGQSFSTWSSAADLTDLPASKNYEALSADLSTLLTNSKASDLVVQTNTKGEYWSFAVHKAILSVRSAEFELKFNNIGRREILQLNGISDSAFRALLIYLYTGKVIRVPYDVALELNYKTLEYKLPAIRWHNVLRARIYKHLQPDDINRGFF